MKKEGKNEKLIDKLMQKRKQENDAFMKLLQAMEKAGKSAVEAKTPKGKSK